MKYGAEENEKMVTPADGPTDWMVKVNGRYVLRLCRPSYPRAREDAAKYLGKLDWGGLEIRLLSEIMTWPSLRGGARRAMKRVPYLRMPKPAPRPVPNLALRELNIILASKKRWTVHGLRMAIASVTGKLVSEMVARKRVGAL